VFALDHDGECKDLMKVYLNCLKENKAIHFDCRTQSSLYLKCRMDRDLMAVEDLNNLGLGELDAGYVRKTKQEEPPKEGTLFLIYCFILN